MGDVVNLRLIRKRKARGEASAAAGENRARHGEAKSGRKLRQARAESAVRHLDGHRIGRKTDEPD